MTVLVISLIAVAAILVGVKVYFQEKEKEELKKAVPTLEKTPEQVVHERLQEIAKFESQIESTEEVPVNVDPVVVKEKSKHKKSNNFKKRKPKAKSTKQI